MGKKDKKKEDSLILDRKSQLETREEQVTALARIDDEYQDYLDSLPVEKRKRVMSHIGGMRHGLQAIAPMTCPGAKRCKFIQHCPIPKKGKGGEVDYGDPEDYPIGRACVMEKFFVTQKTIDYVEHLQAEPDNPVEMSIVNELAIIDLLKNRALMILSSGDSEGQGVDFMRVDFGMADEYGNRQKTTSVHPAVSVIDGLERRREKWLDKFLQTRKAQLDVQLKTGLKEDSRMAQEIHQIRNAIEAIVSKDEDSPIDLHLKD